MCSDSVCPFPCHAFTLYSMFHFCNPLALVRSPTEWSIHLHRLSWMTPMSGRSIGSLTAGFIAHASLNIFHFKRIFICVKCLHVAFQPISAEIKSLSHI